MVGVGSSCKLRVDAASISTDQPVALNLGRRIAVIVPAYREERLIARTLGRMPAYVDTIYVVNDASPDGTLAAAKSAADPRVVCLSGLASFTT